MRHLFGMRSRHQHGRGFAKSLKMSAVIVMVATMLSGCSWFFATGNGNNITLPVHAAMNIAKAGTLMVTVTSTGDVTLFQTNLGAGAGNELTQLDQEVNIGGPANETRYGVVTMRENADGNFDVFVARGSTITRFLVDADLVLELVTIIQVGVETTSLAMTPNGTLLYAPSFNGNEVFVVDTSDNSVIDRIPVNGKPRNVLVTNDGDRSDQDERVYVALYFSRLIFDDGVARQNGFNNSREGVVLTWPVNNHSNVREITIGPIADTGFTKDLTAFCAAAGNDSPFCAPHVDNLAEAVEGGYPNFLGAGGMAAEEKTLWIPALVQSPEPPVSFNTNGQGFVFAINIERDELKEARNLHFNVNTFVRNDNIDAGQGGGANGLQGLFVTEMTGVVFAQDRLGEALYVTSNGDFVTRLPLKDNGGQAIGNRQLVRYPTNILPDGLLFCDERVDGVRVSRLFTMNDGSFDVTIIDPFNANGNVDGIPGNEAAQVIDDSIPAGNLPAPINVDPRDAGNRDYMSKVGEIMFRTALGIEAVGDNDLVDGGATFIPIRDLPMTPQKASSDAWSSCALCHGRYGLTDLTTWIFPTGPRQSVPMSGSTDFTNVNLGDDNVDSLVNIGGGPATNLTSAWKVMNWNGVRTTYTDFNNNARGVQGGQGHSNDPLDIFNFGPNTTAAGVGTPVSNALFSWNVWAEDGVRPLDAPFRDPNIVNLGQTVFQTNCAECHGGGLFSIGEMVWSQSDPTLDINGINQQDLVNGVLTIAGGVQTFDLGGGNVLDFARPVDSFDATDPREVRGAGGQIGNGALGANGFIPPSLMGIFYHAEHMGHNGDFQGIRDAIFGHAPADGAASFGDGLTEEEIAQLIIYLESLDPTATPVNTFGVGGAGGFVQNVNLRQNGATNCPAAANC